MSNSQQKEYTFRVSFVNAEEDPDTLLEWYTKAEDRRTAYLQFFYIHENPDLRIVACEEVFTYSGPVTPPTPLLRIHPATERITFEENSSVLPEFIEVQDDFLIRAVYGLCKLWINENGEEIFREMANSLHAIGAHSMRFALQGEPLSPTADNEAYTYLRDAAFLFDYIATGDNPVYRSSELLDTVNNIFSDLTEN
jgi:hypothetical protein